MIPNLTIGANTISAYMLCTMIGVLVAGTVTIHNAKGKDTLVLTTVLLWAAPGVVMCCMPSPTYQSLYWQYNRGVAYAGS